MEYKPRSRAFSVPSAIPFSRLLRSAQDSEPSGRLDGILLFRAGIGFTSFLSAASDGLVDFGGFMAPEVDAKGPEDVVYVSFPLPLDPETEASPE